jgi:hypothetical protein
MPTVWAKTATNYSRLLGVDPAIDWALRNENAPGRRYFFVSGDPTDWFPVVILLNKGSNVGVRDFWEGIPFIAPKERKAWKETQQIPQFFLHAPQGLDALKVFSAMVKQAFLDKLIDPKLNLVPRIVARIELSLPLRQRSLMKSPGKGAGGSA